MWRKFAITLVAVVALGAASACAHNKPPSEVYREHDSVTAVPPAAPAQTGEPAKPADLLSALSRDLAQRLGVKASALQVLAVESVVWDDGSLGCPQPGQMYVMAQTPGMRVLFQNGGKTYQYHASDKGHFVYCANPAKPAGSHDRQ